MAAKPSNSNTFSNFIKKSESKNENKAAEIMNINSPDANFNSNVSLNTNNKINAVAKSSSSVQNHNPNSNIINTAAAAAANNNNVTKPMSYWDEENSRKLASSILTG